MLNGSTEEAGTARGAAASRLPFDLARSAVEAPPPPPRVLALGVLALAVAAAAGLLWPESIELYSGFVWLLPLVPVFHLSYYRGREGAALALAGAMAVFTGVEVVAEPLLGRDLDGRLFGAVSVLLVAMTLGVSWLSDRFREQRLDGYRMAYEDALTGLPSRRAAELFLDQQFAEAERGHPCSVVLFDIDRFKRYNDEHGHAAGDELLRRVAEAMSAESRRMNVVGRYGGEEFLAVLPGERAEGATAYAERILESVAAVDPEVGDGCTISAGVAAYAPEVASPTELVDRADRALYRAKEAGGDRVRVFGGARHGAVG